MNCAHLVQDSCDIHPNQHEVGPQYGACELGPIDLVLYRGIYCPPVIEAIEKQTGIVVEVNTLNQRFCEAESLRNALSADVIV